MTLHYLGEMTIKAISEFLGVSQNTVKSPPQPRPQPFAERGRRNSAEPRQLPTP